MRRYQTLKIEHGLSLLNNFSQQWLLYKTSMKSCSEGLLTVNQEIFVLGKFIDIKPFWLIRDKTLRIYFVNHHKTCVKNYAKFLNLQWILMKIKILRVKPDLQYCKTASTLISIFWETCVIDNFAAEETTL